MQNAFNSAGEKQEQCDPVELASVQPYNTTREMDNN